MRVETASVGMQVNLPIAITKREERGSSRTAVEFASSLKVLQKPVEKDATLRETQRRKNQNIDRIEEMRQELGGRPRLERHLIRNTKNNLRRN